MRFLPGLASRLSWSTFGGRKFLMIMSVMGFIAYCTLATVTIPAVYLDTLWKLVGIYCTANVGKDGINWLVDKIKGTTPTTAEEYDVLIATLTSTLEKLKTSRPGS